MAPSIEWRLVTRAILGCVARTVNVENAIRSLFAARGVALALHAAVEDVAVHAVRAPDGEPVRPVRLLATRFEVLIEPGRRHPGPLVDPPPAATAGQQGQTERGQEATTHEGACQRSRQRSASFRPRANASASRAGSRSSGRSPSGAPGASTWISMSGCR